MTRVRALLFLILFTFSLPLLFMEFSRWQTAVAAPDHDGPHSHVEWGPPNVGVVFDTTESMGPELDLFTAAWQSTTPYATGINAQLQAMAIPDPSAPLTHWPGPLTATFRLVGFRDVSQFFGSTTDYEEFLFSMSGLPIGGGEGCLDHALGGLLTMAKEMPKDNTPSSDVLLVTDATPMGSKANFVYVVNRMLQRGVNVHSLVSGWCPGTAVPEKALQTLTLATGGRYYRVAQPTDYFTDTLMAHNRLFSTDLLLSEFGSVTDAQPDMIPIQVDSTMFALSAESTLGYTGCLTCPRGLAEGQGITAVGGMQFDLIDPNGNVVNAANPYFSRIGTSSRELLRLTQPLTATLQPGTWHVRVTGNGDYVVALAAQSELHLAYLGPASVPLNQPSVLRVALGQTHDGVTTLPLTANFKLVAVDGQAPDQNITLYDDGLHNDTEAGDGIYAGLVTPSAAGWWRVMAGGQWVDGSSYQRMAEVPFRVQTISAKSPDPATAKPNETQQVSFELTNNAPSGSGAVSFALSVFSEQGWVITDTVASMVNLEPGETAVINAEVVVPSTATDGTLEEITLVAIAIEEDIDISALAEITVEAATVYLPMIVR